MNDRSQHYDERLMPTVAGSHQVAVYNPYKLPSGSNDDLDLRRIWQIIRRYRWLIVSVIAASMITTLILTLSMRPVYRAMTLVELKPNPAIVGLDGMGVGQRNAQEFRNTQVNILRSESVTERVIAKMNLADDPEFNGELKPRGLVAGVRAVKRSVFDFAEELGVLEFAASVSNSLFPSKAASADESTTTQSSSDEPSSGARQERKLLLRYMGKLDVEQISNSNLLELSFESHSPRTAAALANAHATEYISFVDERRFNSTSSAKQYLQTQIEEAEANLTASEQRLTDFARQNNIVDVEDRGNVMQQQFEEISRALTVTRQERIIAEVEYRQAQEQGSLDSLPAVMKNPTTMNLRQQYANLRADYEEMKRTFKDTYPKMQQLKSRMDEIRAALREEAETLVVSLSRRYEQLVDQERELDQQLEEQRTKLLDLKERAISYNILKREWEANRELYSGLLSRQKDFSVASGLEFNDASILDSAVVPTSRYKPSHTKNVTMAGVFGLVIGTGVAFLLAFLDNTFKNREELEQTLGIPFMGIVPSLERTKENELVPISLISAYQPGNAIAEAIRTIRTGVLFSRPENIPKKILITSTMSGEGKSTIAMNLAVILAQSGSSVLLIDGDLRRPVIGKWLNLESEIGLMEYLSGDDSDVIQTTQFENLFAVPAGKGCSRPTDLLASIRMRDYLDAVAERFEFVVVDGPPCLGVADSMLLSAKVDGTLLVVKADSTERHVVAETVNRLRMVNAPLIGSILNFVNLEQPGYEHYGTYYGYGNGRDRKGVEYQQEQAV